MASPQMIYFCVSWATVRLKSPYSPDISAAGAHFIMSGTSHITVAGKPLKGIHKEEQDVLSLERG